jgi:hypothetical protein
MMEDLNEMDTRKVDTGKVDPEGVARALSALREASASERAPEHLEAGLLQAFRARHSHPAPVRSSRTRKYAWIAAVAASLVAAIALRVSRPVVVNAPAPGPVAKLDAPAPPAKVRNEPKLPPRVARAKPSVRGQRKAVGATDRARLELATEFFAVPYAPALTHVDRGQLVRVKVPAVSMRSFGLPVSEERISDRVSADVLMGEDGIVRAIRFVR